MILWMIARTAVGAPAPPKLRVLVADDEPHMLRLIQVNLKQVGIEVATAQDGVEALEKVFSETFDVVFLDVMMPRKDGFEVLKELRSNPAYENLFVILLTAKQHDRDIYYGYHNGADMYLTKPFNPKEILRALGF